MLIHPDNLKYVGFSHRDYKNIDNSDLARHIKDNGLLNPILVFEYKNKYYYESGVRRVMACKDLGINVECRLIHLDETEKQRRIDPKRWLDVASNL